MQVMYELAVPWATSPHLVDRVGRPRGYCLLQSLGRAYWYWMYGIGAPAASRPQRRATFMIVPRSTSM
jgi:hypothetical protein